MNWLMRCSPSFFEIMLETLTTTNTIGISASNVVYASAEAFTGQRFREKLLPTSSQKWANRCSRDGAHRFTDPMPFSSRKSLISDRARLLLAAHFFTR